jgi:hypothetical protein
VEKKKIGLAEQEAAIVILDYLAAFPSFSKPRIFRLFFAGTASPF